MNRLTFIKQLGIIITAPLIATKVFSKSSTKIDLFTASTRRKSTTLRNNISIIRNSYEATNTIGVNPQTFELVFNKKWHYE